MTKYKRKILFSIFIIFTIAIIGWTLSDDDIEEPKDEVVEVTQKKKVSNDKEKTNKVKIDIKGQVNNPGVYELTSNNNVNDAIAAAGGLTNSSDTSNINLSKKLSDEMVIIIYSKSEIEQMNKKDEIVCPEVNNACICESDEKAKLVIDDSNDDLVNINTASLEELLTLNGIGESKAKAIIEYRQKTPFKSIEDIKNVSGIGDGAFEKIKNNITV